MKRLRAGVPLVAASFAALVVPDGWPGLNVTLSAVAVGGSVLLFLERPPKGWALAWGGFALACAAMFTVRAAGWLLAVDLLAAVALGCLAVGDPKTWPGFVGNLMRGLSFPRGAGELLRAPFQDLEVGVTARGALARGVAFSFGLLVLFGTLFLSADVAFAQFAQGLVPEWDPGLIPARVVVFLFTLAAAGGYVVIARRGPVALPNAFSLHRSTPARTEWVLPLVVMNALFLAFVLVQLSVLFGGHTYVLETADVTYAAYARSGFFQLLVVGALTLAVIATSVAWVRPEGLDRSVMRLLLGLLCIWSFVILASAVKRLGLYEEAFGLTRLRFSAHAALLWMGAMFVVAVGAGALWKAAWLPRLTLALTASSLLVLNLVNPDAAIARSNLAVASRVEEVDLGYLANLSLDAVPIIAGARPEIRDCLLPIYAGRLEEDRSWLSWNASVSRAERVIAEAETEECRS